MYKSALALALVASLAVALASGANPLSRARGMAEQGAGDMIMREFRSEINSGMDTIRSELPDMPDVDMPTMPSLSMPSMPNMPNLSMPDMSLPSIRSKSSDDNYDTDARPHRLVAPETWPSQETSEREELT